jgi:hypothetical protein
MLGKTGQSIFARQTRTEKNKELGLQGLIDFLPFCH